MKIKRIENKFTIKIDNYDMIHMFREIGAKSGKGTYRMDDNGYILIFSEKLYSSGYQIKIIDEKDLYEVTSFGFFPIEWANMKIEARNKFIINIKTCVD